MADFSVFVGFLKQVPQCSSIFFTHCLLIFCLGEVDSGNVFDLQPYSIHPEHPNSAPIFARCLLEWALIMQQQTILIAKMQSIPMQGFGFFCLFGLFFHLFLFLLFCFAFETAQGGLEFTIP